METGDLTESIYIQQESRVPTASGGATITWSNTTTSPIWANIIEMRTGEAVKAMAESGTMFFRITIRYRTGVLKSMRIKWGDRYLAIMGSPIETVRRTWLEIRAKETR